VDIGFVGHVFGGVACRAEITVHFHFDALHLDVPFCGFAVDVVAITGCQRKEEQLSAIGAGAETCRFLGNDNGMGIVVCGQHDEMLTFAIVHAGDDLLLHLAFITFLFYF
jgi:hypothetical protein